MPEKSPLIPVRPTARNCIHIKGRLSCPYNCGNIMSNAKNRGLHRQDEVLQRELTPDSDVTEANSEISVVQHDAGEDVLDCAGYEVQRSYSDSQALGNGEINEPQIPTKTTSLNDIFGDRSKQTRSNSLPSTFSVASFHSPSPFQNIQENPPFVVLESCREHVVKRNSTIEPVQNIEQNLPRPTLESAREHVRELNRTIDPGTKTIKEIFLENMTYVIVVLIAVVVLAFSYESNPVGPYQHSDFQKDLYDISVEYDIKNDTMLLIQSGIETTFKNQDTSSMVFLYHDDTPDNMKETRVKEFVEKVAAASAKYLRNEIGTVSPIVVENSDLNVETVGELIKKYQGDLEDKGVLIVQDLEDIPVNLAMAFHYYCDEFDPLVKNTAIFFTLNLAKCSTKDGTTEHEVVESCMTEKWSRLAKAKLSPLLTRVVNVVVDLESGAVDLSR